MTARGSATHQNSAGVAEAPLSILLHAQGIGLKLSRARLRSGSVLAVLPLPALPGTCVHAGPTIGRPSGMAIVLAASSPTPPPASVVCGTWWSVPTSIV
eukprot:5411480-Pyramimonas_sp.AAC.2